MTDKPLLMTLKDREFNLRDALPLTLGDYRTLRAKGIDLMKLEDAAGSDPLQIFDLLVFLLCKTDESLAPDWFEDIGLEDWLGGMEHITEIVKTAPVSKGEGDFLGSSTSSPPSTDGAAATPSS